MISKKDLLNRMNLYDIYQQEVDKTLKSFTNYGKNYAIICTLNNVPISLYEDYELKTIFEPYNKAGYYINYNEKYIEIEWEAE